MYNCTYYRLRIYVSLFVSWDLSHWSIQLSASNYVYLDLSSLLVNHPWFMLMSSWLAFHYMFCSMIHIIVNFTSKSLRLINLLIHPDTKFDYWHVSPLVIWEINAYMYVPIIIIYLHIITYSVSRTWTSDKDFGCLSDLKGHQ